MILLPTLLTLAASGVSIDVMGEGKLRFAAGRTLAFASHATLVRSASGLLADEAGRPMVPQIGVPTPNFTVGMGGKVTSGGRVVGQIVLERPGAGGDFGVPGSGTFGLLKVGGLVAAGAAVAPKKAPVASQKPIVQIHPNAQVAGDRIQLGDVADVTGDPAMAARLKAIDLGPTPLLGCDRTLMKYGVLAALRDQGIGIGEVDVRVPVQAKVSRLSQTIESRRILDEATKAVDPTAEAGDIPFQIGPRPLVTEPGEVTFTTLTKKSSNGRVEVTVGILVGGRPVGERVVQLAPKLVGVKAGDAVRVLVERNGATLETDGKARTAGNVGETIQIATPDGALLTATVTGIGQVEVRL